MILLSFQSAPTEDRKGLHRLIDDLEGVWTCALYYPTGEVLMIAWVLGKSGDKLLYPPCSNDHSCNVDRKFALPCFLALKGCSESEMCFTLVLKFFKSFLPLFLQQVAAINRGMEGKRNTNEEKEERMLEGHQWDEIGRVSRRRRKVMLKHTQPGVDSQCYSSWRLKIYQLEEEYVKHLHEKKTEVQKHWRQWGKSIW